MMVSEYRQLCSRCCWCGSQLQANTQTHSEVKCRLNLWQEGVRYHPTGTIYQEPHTQVIRYTRGGRLKSWSGVRGQGTKQQNQEGRYQDVRQEDAAETNLGKGVSVELVDEAGLMRGAERGSTGELSGQMRGRGQRSRGGINGKTLGAGLKGDVNNLKMIKVVL